MLDYNNGKVYKIVNTIGETIYIGSTTQSLCQRYQRHKYKNKDHRIILIENYSCNSKEELLRHEQKCIDENRNCNLLNKNNAYVSREDYKKKKCVYNKKCYKQHRTKIRQLANQKIECKNCGCFINRLNLARHRNTDKCRVLSQTL